MSVYFSFVLGTHGPLCLSTCCSYVHCWVHDLYMCNSVNYSRFTGTYICVCVVISRREQYHYPLAVHTST